MQKFMGYPSLVVAGVWKCTFYLSCYGSNVVLDPNHPKQKPNKQKNAVAFITWLIYAVVQAFEIGVAGNSFEVQLNVKCLPHAFKKAPLHADYVYPEILHYSVVRTCVDSVFCRTC